MSDDDKKVNDDCWAGLKTLQDSGLIQPSSEECNDIDIRLCSSWSNSLQFDADGNVTLVDLGGKRLYKGFPCSPKVFAQFSRLVTLNLAGTDLPLQDLSAILEQVAPRIETLYVGGNGLGVDGAKALGSWLPSASKLVSLDLRYKDIGGLGMEALCVLGLKDNNNKNNNSNVQYLYLEGNQLGDQGAIALAELLKDETNGASALREVFMGANQIQSKGAIEVALSLKYNKVVSKIYLEGNNIGLEGAEAFSTVLEELDGNTALKKLFVDNNNIGKEGSQRLAMALNSESAIGGSLLDG
jgi:Ran GTPase-activating protein (RanGAP) involved in mRNA processing and transport